MLGWRIRARKAALFSEKRIRAKGFLHGSQKLLKNLLTRYVYTDIIKHTERVCLKHREQSGVIHVEMNISCRSGKE